MKSSIIVEGDSDIRIEQIQADDGPWWRMREEEGVVEVAKRTVSDSLCDTRDYPGCGGPLYRWTQQTTLDYWPVIRCENHIKLQRRHMQYWEEWSSQHEWWEREEPLWFFDWLKEHWNDDTLTVEGDFRYWELAAFGD
jgi:hypothetical protein